MNIPFGRALYYPHINFTDQNWLKTAALYYDGIYRIVPGEDLIEEVDFIQRLNDSADSDESKFVRNIDPRPYAHNVSTDFLEFMERELAAPKQRQRLLNSVAHIIPSNAEYWIHFDKMGYELMTAMDKYGIALRKESFHFEDFLVLDPVVGSLYMTKLANHIAKAKCLPLISDDLNFQSLIKTVQQDQSSGDNGFAMASIVFKTVIPKDIDSVSERQVIEFRQKYSSERQQFYNAINNLVSDLDEITDQQSLKDALYHRKGNIEKASKDIKAVLNSIGVNTVLGVTTINVPPLLENKGYIAAAVGTIAIAIGNVYLSNEAKNKVGRDNPYSYVFALRNRLCSESFARMLLKGKILI